MHFPTQNPPTSSYHHAPGKITHSPRQHSFEKIFSQIAEKVEETMIYFVKIQSENMKGT